MTPSSLIIDPPPPPPKCFGGGFRALLPVLDDDLLVIDAKRARKLLVNDKYCLKSVFYIAHRSRESILHEPTMLAMAFAAAPSGVARLVTVCDTDSGLIFVCERGDVLDVLMIGVTLDELARLLDTLATLHAHSILHGDVKPGNIVRSRDDNQLKLIDFEHACVLLPTVYGDGVPASALWDHDKRGGGTEGYLAPERCGNVRLTAAVDVYAFGVMLRNSDAAARCRSKPLLNALVGAMLDDEPTQRPTAATAAEQLRAIAAAERPEKLAVVEQRRVVVAAEQPKLAGVKVNVARQPRAARRSPHNNTASMIGVASSKQAMRTLPSKNDKEN